MTLDQLLDEAARVALVERKSYSLTRYHDGTWLVDRHDVRPAVILKEGEHSDCHLWIERKGIEAFCRYIAEHCCDCPEFMNAVRDCWAPAHAVAVFKALAGEVEV